MGSQIHMMVGLLLHGDQGATGCGVAEVLARAAGSCLCTSLLGASSSLGRAMAKNLPIKQLTVEKQSLIDDVVRTSKGSATDAMEIVNAKRLKKGIRPLEKSAIYRFVNGGTHTRNVEETRGRKRSLSKKDIRKLDQTRRRLIIEADSEHMVTYSQIVKDAGVEGVAGLRACQDALRGEGVSFKPARQKIQVSEADAKIRHDVVKMGKEAEDILDF